MKPDSEKYRRLAIELHGVARDAQEALWNCMELAHGSNPESNHYRLCAACEVITDRMNSVKRVMEKEKRPTALEALKELRGAISNFGGHGMPGFTDRALAIIVMAQADRVLEGS